MSILYTFLVCTSIQNSTKYLRKQTISGGINQVLLNCSGCWIREGKAHIGIGPIIAPSPFQEQKPSFFCPKDELKFIYPWLTITPFPCSSQMCLKILWTLKSIGGSCWNWSFQWNWFLRICQHCHINPCSASGCPYVFFLMVPQVISLHCFQKKSKKHANDTPPSPKKKILLYPRHHKHQWHLSQRSTRGNQRLPPPVPPSKEIRPY